MLAYLKAQYALIDTLFDIITKAFFAWTCNFALCNESSIRFILLDRQILQLEVEN